MATKPWRFAPLRRTALVLLVVAVGAAVGVGTVAMLQGGGRAKHRPPTPSVAAFPLPARGVIQPVAMSATPESLAEPTSALAALEAFLGSERDSLPARSYALLTAADQQDVGSAAAWAATAANRPAPVTFTVMSEQVEPDGEQISVDVARHPSLNEFGGFVSARATQVWRVAREGATWRVSAAPLTEDPVLPQAATATSAVGRWVQALAACDRAGAASMQGVAHLIGPEDLVAAPCQERGSWMVTGQPIALDRAPDVQAFVEAYGPDVGTWTRLVPVRGPSSHFLAAVAPLGDDWRVIGVTSDGG